MKFFLLTIGLHNSDKGVWFDDIIVKGKHIPDHLDLIRTLKSRYFSTVIGVTSIKEVPNLKSQMQQNVIEFA